MNLFEKDSYLNKSISTITGLMIIEYDIKEAGWTAVKSRKLVSETDIAYLSTLSKTDRNIAIGKMNYKYENLSNNIIDIIREIRIKFAEDNKIEEHDVLAIRKDAIFIINKNLTKLQFDDFLFRNKEKYTSYMRVNKLEYYFNSMTNKIDIKGINDDTLKLHTSGFLDLLSLIMRNSEFNNQDITYNVFKSIINKYTENEYHINTYREFNTRSMFKTKFSLGTNKNIYIENAADVMFDILDTSYNHMELISIFKVLF